MAVARVSAGDPNAVCTLSESRQKKLGIHPAGARHPDYPDVWGILQSAHTGKICGAVRAPVAEEGNYLWLPVAVSTICHSFSLKMMWDVGYGIENHLALHPTSHISHLLFTTPLSLQKYACPRTLSGQWRPNGRTPHTGHNPCTKPDLFQHDLCH
jgi:hypothetical protein